ncbi:MAG: hypothetical protein WC860_09145 [Candidatus Margulisiibacteriota bacterium]|jgi:hypothetical protein
MKEVIISDDKNTIIDKKEIETKIQKLMGYQKKVEQRLAQLSREFERICHQGNEEQLEQGLNYYHLVSNISKQI